ncbi:MAG TPA: hypothetical protein VE990_18730 [Acidimicrobiales bacterium]|nr:hypothetical protein [Acidimicrobiales bacterium]
MSDTDQCLVCGGPMGDAADPASAVPDFCAGCREELCPAEARPAPMAATVADVAMAMDRALGTVLGLGRMMAGLGSGAEGRGPGA